MLPSKLPKVGTTIFTVMSQLAQEHGAVNLGQGFPDFDVPARLVEELERAMRAGHNQYAPMTGVASLRQAIAAKSERVYGHRPDADAEVTVTSGATEAIFNAIHAVVRAGDEVIVLDPCYDCYEPAIELAGARAVQVDSAMWVSPRLIEMALGEKVDFDKLGGWRLHAEVTGLIDRVAAAAHVLDEDVSCTVTGTCPQCDPAAHRTVLIGDTDAE